MRLGVFESLTTSVIPGLIRDLYVNLFVLTLITQTFSLPVQADDEVSVFAASSLAGVIEEILKSAPDDISTRTSFAGTGTVARQIEAGAPADIFISANGTWIDYLNEKDLLQKDTARHLAANHLVLVSPKTSKLPGHAPYHLLQNPKVYRIAIGETATVPAGTYGRQVLETMGLWETIKPKLLPADSVRNVLSWVEHGEADLAFIYQSDALSSGKVKVRHIFRPSIRQKIKPIYYTAALVKGASSDDIDRLYAHLSSAPAKEAFRAHGFEAVP